MPITENKGLYNVETNLPLGRYIDLTKFVSMISTSTIFFSRADKFEDPYEGRLNKHSVSAMQEWEQHLSETFYKESYADETERNAKVEKDVKFYEAYREITTISCWHTQDFENALMWKSYSNTNNGILIITDYESLKRAFNASKENITPSLVKYIDWEKQFVPAGNTFYPFIHKPIFYTYEKELRLMYPIADMPLKADWSKQKSQYGVAIDCNMNDLIQKIIVAPFATDSYFENIESLAKKYGINSPIERSQLAYKK